MGTTKVINIKEAPFDWSKDDHYVYIGRAGKGFDGYFGNPFRLGRGESRGETLNRYAHWLADKVKTDAEYRRRVKELKGKTLVCFCKPLACHGDILAHATDAHKL